MLIEGRNAVLEALRAETTIDKLCIVKDSTDATIKRIIAMAIEARIKIIYVAKQKLDNESSTGKHQGVIAYATEYNYCEMEDILQNKKGKNHFIIILDGLEDPHNFGAIVRTAEAVGVDGIIIGKHRQVGVSDIVVKTSVGATQYVKIAKVTNINDAIRQLKDRFIKVIATDADGVDMSKSYLTGDIAIVIGGEGSGVKALTRKLSDEVVSIPMFGNINSLNASVAAGVVLYEAVRQRK